MHDATEGGVAAALNEMAEASNVGFKFDWSSFLFPNLGSHYNPQLASLVIVVAAAGITAVYGPCKLSRFNYFLSLSLRE